MQSPHPDAGHRTAGATPGAASLLARWMSTTGSRIRVVSELAAAEARLAAISVAMMSLLAMLSAVFVLGAWGFAMAAIALGLAQLGWPLWATMLGLALAHLAAATLIWHATVRVSKHVAFTATRQQLAQPNGHAA